MELTEEDIIIEEWLHKNGNIVHPRAVIIRTTCAEKTKQQILKNQEIVDRLRERIKEDIDNCLCLSGRACTYCHDRRTFQKILGDKE